MLTDASVAAIAASGFTTVIVGLFHIHADGSLVYNDTPVDRSITATISKLKSISGSTVQTVLFSIGRGNWPRQYQSVSDDDYPQMKATWNTSKTSILNFLKDAGLDGLDLDYEPVEITFDVGFIAQVTNEIKVQGYLMTAAPYTDTSDWMAVLKKQPSRAVAR